MPKSDPGARLSTSQKVEAAIKQAIFQGRLKPRERIIEDDIARELGCSRGPVREAMLRLERDGMIVTKPRRGTFIRDIPPDEVEVVFSIRGKLEALCARYMRQNMSPETEPSLRKCLAAMKAARGDAEAFLQADMRLHRTIWKLSRQQQLYRTLTFTMNPLFAMIARNYTPLSNDEAYKNHEGYVAMLLSVPVSRVEREVERYFKELYKVLEQTVFQPFTTASRSDLKSRDGDALPD
jgi:DNA-binding GntR family transcriptional regulator